MKRIYADGLIAVDDDEDVLNFFGVSNITPKRLRKELTEATGDDVELWINSVGGDLWAAQEMYAELSKHVGHTTAVVTGLAASAATILMLGCQEVKATIGAQFMIHNATSTAEGDYHDMNISAEQLRKANDSILAVYMKKTGKSYDDLKHLMERTTWMNAEDALSNGFIDSIDPLESAGIAASAPCVDIEALREKYKSLHNKALEANAVKEEKPETVGKEEKYWLKLEKARFCYE